MLLGDVHVVVVNTLPTLGPKKIPVVDTAVAVRPVAMRIGAFATKAVKVLMVKDSTNTSCPLREASAPVKPASTNPSLTVGSEPLYVKVTKPPDPDAYPVINSVVA
jgi:hypothetical protein